jgi:hypothetical protein
MDTGESSFQLGHERGPARMWRMVAAPKAARFAPLAYPVARAAAVLLTASGFFAIHLLGAWFIGSALTHDVLTLTQARWIWVVGLASASFFAGHTAAIGLLDAYVQRRVRLPEALPPLPSRAQPASNPWNVALQTLCIWGGVAAAISSTLLPSWWSKGVPLTHFAWQFAAASAVLSGGVVWQHTGQRFLDQARLAPERRRFAGSLNAYVWRRHVLPQGLINAVLNGWIGAAIVPAALHQTGAVVPAGFVQRDAIGTAVMLTLVIAVGVRSYALFESRWGVAPVPMPLEASRQTTPRARLLLAGMWVALSACVLLSLTQLPALSVWTFLLSRALGCGVLSAAVAYAVAHRTVRGAAAVTEDAS